MQRFDRILGTSRQAAWCTLFSLLVAVRAASADVDLTGSWWVHADPYIPDNHPSIWADVRFDVVQSGSTLTITNVVPTHGADGPGSGSGTIAPATGELDAFYGYVYLFEPVSTALDATASPDGLTLSGTAHVTVIGSPPFNVLYDGPVLGVRFTGAATCGNGAFEFGEECDDGNTASGDGCSDVCVREPRCGDRIRDPGEDCDDGNTTNGDGCSATCTREPRCGDGVVDPGEECDDGNSNEADACSSSCERLATCGNNVVEFGEQCDDGNTMAGDCCSPTCRIQTGICRPAVGPCDQPESCLQGICPPDPGDGDPDHDGLCSDGCYDGDGSRTFLARSRLTISRLNDEVRDNGRLSLRARFMLDPSTPLSGFDPTQTTTLILVSIAPDGTGLNATLPALTFAGPGTAGWRPLANGRGWRWRDLQSPPTTDVIAARLSATATGNGERVRVTVKARATGRFVNGVPWNLSEAQLPIQTSVTFGTPFFNRRCGQSRFARSDCLLRSDGHRLVCRQ